MEMEKPPPPPDLEDVYRPFEDPGLRTAVEEATPDFEPEHELGELGDLLGMGGPAPATVSSNAVVDLSQASREKADAAPAPAAPVAPAPPRPRPAVDGQAAMKRIPANAKGFGSDDLFGAPKPKDDSIFETVCKMLPEQVTSRVDCLQVPVETETEVQAPVAQAPQDLSAEHTATAVNRTVEGRWVPTYMRQQLAAGGHTSLPQAPNGHEFSANAQPPTCGQAFVDMGHDFGEGAQAVLEFMAAIFTSLTFQCQACSHHAISTAHEQVMALGDDWCGFADAEEEVGPAPSDWQAYRHAMDASNDASLGPSRDTHLAQLPAQHVQPLAPHLTPADAVPAPCSFGAERPEAKMEAGPGPVDKDLLMQVASAI